MLFCLLFIEIFSSHHVWHQFICRLRTVSSKLMTSCFKFMTSSFVSLVICSAKFYSRYHVSNAVSFMSFTNDATYKLLDTHCLLTTNFHTCYCMTPYVHVGLVCIISCVVCIVSFVTWCTCNCGFTHCLIKSKMMISKYVSK